MQLLHAKCTNAVRRAMRVEADGRLLLVCRGRRYEGKGRSSRWSRQPLVQCADVALGWDELLDDLSTC
jgi:hypothetical protein